MESTFDIQLYNCTNLKEEKSSLNTEYTFHILNEEIRDFSAGQRACRLCWSAKKAACYIKPTNFYIITKHEQSPNKRFSRLETTPNVQQVRNESKSSRRQTRRRLTASSSIDTSTGSSVYSQTRENWFLYRQKGFICSKKQSAEQLRKRKHGQITKSELCVIKSSHSLKWIKRHVTPSTCPHEILKRQTDLTLSWQIVGYLPPTF